MVFARKNKITIEEGEDITPGEMMFLYDINNNKTIYDMLFLGGYQDEYEYIYLYQEINNYLGWNQDKTKLLNLWCMLLMQ